MAFASHGDFHRPSSQLTVDTKPINCVGDFDALDDAILSSSIMSPMSAHRRESFADSNAPMFSPQNGGWGDFPVSAVSSNSLFKQDNNPFNQLDPAQAAAYGQQPSNWPVFDRSSASCTPTVNSISPTFDHVGLDFDSGAPSNYTHVASKIPPAYHGLPLQNNMPPSSIFSSSQSTSIPAPLSPHNNKEWMALAAQEAESRPLPKRMRPSTPPRTYSPFPRRDGIRKKNARFDIPAERSLMNIDQLIAQSTNEEEIKELKQQKRLLRNRQAALDSRQRKKKHTEDLEEEKKLWTERVAALEDDLASLRMQVEALVHDKEELRQAYECSAQLVETLRWEKEELVRSHTLETAELRKKNSFLTKELETASSTTMSVPGSTPCFSDLTSDMSNFTMGPTDLESYCWVDDFCIDPEFAPTQPTSHPHHQQETTLVLSPRRKDPLAVGPTATDQNTEQSKQPVASGLLLMLLLCGAFVASRSSNPTVPVTIPRMPDDVRAASATVLNNILNDDRHNTQQQHLAVARFDSGGGSEPAVPNGWPKSTLSGAEFASLSTAGAGQGGAGGSSLDALHSRLVAPTREQEAEQLFSMSAAQYGSLTSTGPGLEDEEHKSVPSRRRNLADVLAAMRESARGDSAAEVYTRSLMWERIPGEVVREFRRMVQEGGGGS